MLFSDFVCFDALIPEVESSGRDEVIEELVSALWKAGQIKKKDVADISQAIIKRENEASTGMGKGVALPHIKTDKVKKVIAAVGRSVEGIDFSSLDKKPAYSVILLVSPENDTEQHLKAMECVFKRLQNEKFRKFLSQSDTPERIEDLLREADENPDLY